MIRKTVTYTDFDGTERTEDAYFNINKTELMEMDAFSEGGLLARLKEIVQLKDTKTTIIFFKDLLHKAYGIKSPDGRRLIKSEEIWNDFVSTQAYDEIFTELFSDASAAADFIEKVLPKADGKMYVPKDNTQEVLQKFVDANAPAVGGKIAQMPPAAQ